MSFDLRDEAAVVKVYRRPKDSGTHEDLKRYPYQCDIYVSGGGDHHGVGSSPPQALLRAAAHWDAYFASKV